MKLVWLVSRIFAIVCLLGKEDGHPQSNCACCLIPVSVCLFS